MFLQRSTRLSKFGYQKLLFDSSVKFTLLNYLIQQNYNTISNLNYLLYCLYISKQQTVFTSIERIYNFTQENSYFREELAIYKNTRTVLRDLQERSKQTYQILYYIFQDLSRRLARSEKRLLNY